MQGERGRTIVPWVAFIIALSCATASGCKGKDSQPDDAPAAQGSKKPQALPKHPNVILLSIDTLRADHLTPYGYARDTSPNLAAMAKDSVLFEGAYAAHTNTAPAHASMLTSLYPIAHGIRRNGMRIKDGVASLPEILAARGYATGAFVSGWTLRKHIGLDQKFQVYDDNFPGERKASDTYDRARDWFREVAAKKQSFFMFLHFFDPHYVYDPPRAHALRFVDPGYERYVREPLTPDRSLWRRIPEKKRSTLVGLYDGEIAFSDSQVGRLLADLEMLGVLEHTLVVLVSDHGETLFERDWGPDHGGRAYDEQIRIPLMFRFPKGVGRGKRIPGDKQVHHVDLMPTIVEWLGFDKPGGMSGLSMMPLIDGKEGWPEVRPVFSHAQAEPKRVPKILARAKLTNKGLVRSIRLPDVKLIEYPLQGGGWFRELFLLKDDPHEDNNVSDQNQELSDALHARLEAWRKSLDARSDLPAPQFSPEIEEGLRALGYIE